ncbi:putative RING finger protein P8B7.23 [Cytospora mali]|uniref:RING finger protein P8B7.23 n=1 Tax=Cytospora mali TaxID=578113 RepID=A0A194UUR0_CYTMA|nr:putative RING finger protein P8B7.23 [Valsa mali var. pyri (nom. inval.)]
MSTPSSLGGKSSSAQPSASYSNTPFAPATSSNFDSNRRSSQGSQSLPIAAPRKGQAQRRQHRNQRRAGSYKEDEDEMDEIRAIRNASSRRGQTSITHLLNYSSPRPQFENHHYSYNRNYRRNPTWGSGHHAADKARYVHANYRFIVSPKGNYSKQAVDADVHFDWADVLQVLASAESQAASCPICLSEPVAPRMANCGHIFCLPCLIRFMHSTSTDEPTVHDKKPRWRKCPICDDSIYTSEVRPVRFYAGQESPLPRPGDDVVLRLMMRYDKSTLALPKEGGAEVLNSADEIPWHFAANVLDYARVMRGTAGYMTAQYDHEIEELTKQEKEDELLFNEDGEWTQRAIKAIKAAKDKVNDLGEVEVAVAEASSKASSSNPHHVNDFYFYTSPPHLYLSPLDIRILKTKYGSFSQFPSTLLPRVEHISTGNTVDDALRKRAKYLGHLPRGCLISFLECDWTDIVPDDILDTFKDEIERRRKRNRDKEAQEERERIQAERIESAAYRRGQGRGGLSSMDDGFTVRYSDEGNSDRLNLDEFQPLGTSSTTPPNPRPGFSSLESMSTSPSTQKTVWGTRALATSPRVGPTEPGANANDGWLQEDQFLESLGTADLAAQMEVLGVQDSTPDGPSGGSGGGKKKKKQKQKITLMSTGGRRGT